MATRNFIRGLAISLALAFSVTWAARATDEQNIEWVLLHPPVDAFYSCSEHFAGQFKHLGDALGTDCVVRKLVEIDGRMWSREHAGDGTRNEDWYGWNKPLLAPCDCEVVKVHENPVQNEPGILGKPPSSSLVFKREDGVHVLFAHIQKALVQEGDRVQAGEPVASIGNNGYGRTPHLHAAAWKENTPLQIRWDQRRMQLPPEYRKQD